MGANESNHDQYQENNGTQTVAQATGGSDIENQEMVVGVVARDQTDRIDVPDTISISTSVQATSSFNMTGRSRRLSPFEVLSNGNAALGRHQTGVGMSVTAPLLPQTPIADHATSNPTNLPLEEGQNSPGVANEPPRPNAAGDINNKELIINEAKEVVIWVITVSTGGLLSVFSGVIGNEDAVTLHKLFFKAFTILCYIGLALSLALHRLIKISPDTRGFETIVKITIIFSQGSTIYAVSCAVCILFPSKVGVIFILVVPLVLIGLVATLGSRPTDWFGPEIYTIS